jgi:hypothetical protein
MMTTSASSNREPGVHINDVSLSQVEEDGRGGATIRRALTVRFGDGTEELYDITVDRGASKLNTPTIKKVQAVWKHMADEVFNKQQGVSEITCTYLNNKATLSTPSEEVDGGKIGVALDDLQKDLQEAHETIAPYTECVQSESGLIEAVYANKAFEYMAVELLKLGSGSGRYEDGVDDDVSRRTGSFEDLPPSGQLRGFDTDKNVNDNEECEASFDFRYNRSRMIPNGDVDQRSWTGKANLELAQRVERLNRRSKRINQELRAELLQHKTSQLQERVQGVRARSAKLRHSRDPLSLGGSNSHSDSDYSNHSSRHSSRRNSLKFFKGGEPILAIPIAVATAQLATPQGLALQVVKKNGENQDGRHGDAHSDTRLGATAAARAASESFEGKYGEHIQAVPARQQAFGSEIDNEDSLKDVPQWALTKKEKAAADKAAADRAAADKAAADRAATDRAAADKAAKTNVTQKAKQDRMEAGKAKETQFKEGLATKAPRDWKQIDAEIEQARARKQKTTVGMDNDQEAKNTRDRLEKLAQFEQERKQRQEERQNQNSESPWGPKGGLSRTTLFGQKKSVEKKIKGLAEG